MANLNCFKVDGIYGLIDQEFDEFMAFRIGFAMAAYLNAKNIVVGGDNRLSTPAFQRSVIHGLRSANCNVINIGTCGTQELHFATDLNQCDGAIMITGSLGDEGYNGMKLVGSQNVPITNDNGLLDIKRLADQYQPNEKPNFGRVVDNNYMDQYLQLMLKVVPLDNIKPLKIVVNAGNGTAGPIINAIEAHFNQHSVPVQFIKLNNQPDGDFPLGIPNPQLAHQQKLTQEAVTAYHADLGLAWDIEFQQCYFFDAQGNYIECNHIDALIASSMSQAPGEQQKTNSAPDHYCDLLSSHSGMLSWMKIIELMSINSLSLNQLACQQIDAYSTYADINCDCYNTDFLFDTLEQTLAQDAIEIEHNDGLSMTFNEWCFNLRWSNTQSLIKLNVQSQSNPQLMKQQTTYLLDIIEHLPGPVYS